MIYETVYKITNVINGKEYIGQTTRTFTKCRKHHVRGSKTSNYPLRCAIRKYGESSFKKEILVRCLTQEELDKQETAFGILLETLSLQGY